MYTKCSPLIMKTKKRRKNEYANKVQFGTKKRDFLRRKDEEKNDKENKESKGKKKIAFAF